nr:MAG TPA: hypothetical protein [Caudoviricetes sp.]
MDEMDESSSEFSFNNLIVSSQVEFENLFNRFIRCFKLIGFGEVSTSGSDPCQVGAGVVTLTYIKLKPLFELIERIVRIVLGSEC